VSFYEQVRDLLTDDGSSSFSGPGFAAVYARKTSSGACS